MSDSLADVQVRENRSSRSFSNSEKNENSEREGGKAVPSKLELQAVAQAYTPSTPSSRRGGFHVEYTWGEPAAKPAEQPLQPAAKPALEPQPPRRPAEKPAQIPTVPRTETPAAKPADEPTQQPAIDLGRYQPPFFGSPLVKPEGPPVVPPFVRPADGAAVLPRPIDGTAVAAERPGVLALQYGDPQFDEKLRAGNFDTLKISGLPQGVQISPWLDNTGFFFWYINGDDSRARHYMPPSLRNIEINGETRSVDSMRVKTAEAYGLANDPNRTCNRAIDGQETVFQFGARMSGLSDQVVQTQVKNLREAAASSDNPYLHLMLANYMCADVVRPVIANFDPRSQTVQLNDANVNKALDDAQKEARRTRELARSQRDWFVQFQAERLETMIVFSKAMMTLVPAGGFELPPNLPGR